MARALTGDDLSRLPFKDLVAEIERRRSLDEGPCSCGNRFDGDNLCMSSACQEEM